MCAKCDEAAWRDIAEVLRLLGSVRNRLRLEHVWAREIDGRDA